MTELISYVALFALSFPMAKYWNKSIAKNKDRRIKTLFDCKTNNHKKANIEAYLLMVSGVGLVIQRWLSLALIIKTFF